MRDLSAIRGFLTPAMTGSEHGRTLNAFSNPRDVDMIQKGYACGECCAIFTGFRLDCPLCGLPTHVTRQQQAAPDLWQSHVDQRHADVQTLGLGRREIELPPGFDRSRGPEQFLGDLAHDRDVDQVPLSKLKPSKHGRGG